MGHFVTLLLSLYAVSCVARKSSTATTYAESAIPDEVGFVAKADGTVVTPSRVKKRHSYGAVASHRKKKGTSRQKKKRKKRITGRNFIEDKKFFDEHKDSFENGYIVFPLAHGGLANQIEAFVGAMKTARALYRTLILPPFMDDMYGARRGDEVREDNFAPFEDVFSVDDIRRYVPCITAQDFLKDVAPKLWQPDKRVLFSSRKVSASIDMFYRFLGLTFTNTIDVSKLIRFVNPNYAKIFSVFSVAQYPLLAMDLAPVTLPLPVEDRDLQRYVVWSSEFERRYLKFINSIPRPFIGMHLRGEDNACVGKTSFMESTTCGFGLRGSTARLTYDHCVPNEEEIRRQIQEAKEYAGMTDIGAVYLGTKYPHRYAEMVDAAINDGSQTQRAEIMYYTDSHHHSSKFMDLYTLSLSDWFVGTCWSSYSGFVARYRSEVTPFKSSVFFGFNSSEWNEVNARLV